MSLYVVTNHVLLSDAAKELGPQQLEAYALVSESLLKLDTITAFDRTSAADSYNKAAAAVALQISFLVESGIEAFVLASWVRGARSKSYRKGGRNMPVVHPVARKMASQLRTLANA